MDLTPELIVEMFRGIIKASLNISEEEVGPAYPGRRKFPLFRQEGKRRQLTAPELQQDCRRLVAARAGSTQLSDGSLLQPEVIADLEFEFQHHDPEYELGHLLSLFRLALEISDTGKTMITAVERRSFHQLGRRLQEMQRSERPADSDHVCGVLAVLKENNPIRLRELADLMRYLDEVTHHPLLGWPQYAAVDSLHLLLALHHNALIARKRRPDILPTALETCLGARCVLANARIHHLRVGALLDQVLTPDQPLWEDLHQWLDGIGPRESSSTLPLAPSALDTCFNLDDERLEPVELVLRVARRLATNSRSQPVSSPMVALERTLYRKVYRQEGQKHHMGVLLRRGVDHAIQSSHKKALRQIRTATDSLTQPSNPTASELWPDSVWQSTLRRVDNLERCRTSGYTPSGLLCAEFVLSKEDASMTGLVSDLDELLRWWLNCRENLFQSLMARPTEARGRLIHWFMALRIRTQAHDDRRRAEREHGGKRHTAPWSPTTPLQWLAASAHLMVQAPQLESDLPEDILPETDKEVSELLRTWQTRMPWETRLFGVWPSNLRGPVLGRGLRQGIAEARAQGIPPTELEVRLDLLERELEYRSWLGAHERRRLFDSTIHD